MKKIYERIWLKEETLSDKDFDSDDNHNLCYLALYYASKQEIADAQNVLGQINQNGSEHSCNVVLEAKALVSLYLKEINAAKSCAIDALKKDSNSVYANWILARISLREKKYLDAIGFYQTILKIFPGGDNTTVNIAEAYLLLKNFTLAKQYLEKAKPSARKRLYLFFLPFRFVLVRLLWIVLAVVLLATSPYSYLLFYLLLSIPLIYIFIKWGYRQGDIVLINSVTYIQSINSIFFFIALCGLLNKS